MSRRHSRVLQAPYMLSHTQMRSTQMCKSANNAAPAYWLWRVTQSGRAEKPAHILTHICNLEHLLGIDSLICNTNSTIKHSWEHIQPKKVSRMKIIFQMYVLLITTRSVESLHAPSLHRSRWVHSRVQLIALLTWSLTFRCAQHRWSNLTTTEAKDIDKAENDPTMTQC